MAWAKNELHKVIPNTTAPGAGLRPHIHVSTECLKSLSRQYAIPGKQLFVCFTSLGMLSVSESCAVLQNILTSSLSNSCLLAFLLVITFPTCPETKTIAGTIVIIKCFE